MGGLPSTPSSPKAAAQMAKRLSSGGGAGSGGVGRVGPQTGKEIHPALQRYSNVVHVTGDDEDDE